MTEAGRGRQQHLEADTSVRSPQPCGEKFFSTRLNNSASRHVVDMSPHFWAVPVPTSEGKSDLCTLQGRLSVWRSKPAISHRSGGQKMTRQRIAKGLVKCM